jgi:hypothetical protein
MKNKNTLLSIILFFGALATSVAQPVPSYVPVNGLVSWYPFSGNANDESGNGNHATVNGAVLTNDRFSTPNAAYAYDGVNDYLFGNASTFPVAERTVAVWMYTNSINANSLGMQVFGYGGGTCSQSWLMQIDNLTPFTAFFTNNSYELSIGCNNWLTALPFGVNGTPQTPNNNWQHWVITNGPGGVDFYINGNYAGGITNPISGTGVAGKNFFIGACSDSTGMMPFQDAYLKFWNGILDDIGIWNRVLTQQEISGLYNGGQVGLNDVASHERLSIFPNPTQELINLTLDESYLGLPYSIYDMYGNAILNERVERTNFSVVLSNFSAGLYYMRIGNNVLQRFQIIK